MNGKPLLSRLGPTIIVASVVIGPGSIVTASKAGAHFGYSLVWVLVSAAVFMATYTLMAARIGCATDQSILSLAAGRFGRPLAALVGLSAFFVVAGFQFGNNLGVATAMEGITGMGSVYWPIVFNLISLAMLFGFKNLYKALEVLMKILVGLMVLSFVANLFYTGIDLGEFLRGLAPSLAPESDTVALGMFPTTFSVVAAIYAAHLVQEKMWKGADEAAARGDAVVGVSILCFISLTILCGAANAFHGLEDLPVNTAAELARTLDELFGRSSKLIFCLGLAAASFSSFLVNAMIGGGLLADGLGLDRRLGSWPLKAFTTAALLIGMGVAMIVLATGKSPVNSILFAQASTLLAVPICALLLLVLANDKTVLAERRNGPLLNLLGGLGLVVLLWMTWSTGVKVWGAVVGG